MDSNNTVDTKTCPFCAETIKKSAVKCRYCMSDLSEDHSFQNGICINCGSSKGFADAYDVKCDAGTPAGKRNVPVKKNSSDLKCPRCKSTSISANNKGFGVGKAAAGGILLGPVGLLGGMLGSSKVKVTCLKCGKSWAPGQR